MLARGNAVDFHPRVVLETAEEFGRYEEILAAAAAVFAMRGTGDVDETRVDEPEGLSVRDTLSVDEESKHTVRCEGPCLG